MAVFEYTAKDAGGNVFSGVYRDVDSIRMLRQDLSRMGYSLVKARREKNTVRKTRIKQSDIVAFAYEFAGMYSAGLSIVRCLETYEAQSENAVLGKIVRDIRSRVEAGSPLKEAFEKHREVFSEFFTGMIEAGESGGKLAETLQMAAEYLEKQAELKSKIMGALAYPITVAVMCVLIVTALVIFVVPVFQKLYAQLHISLPLPTQVLIVTSQAVRSYWWIIVPSIALLAYSAQYYSRIPGMRARIDQFRLSMPILGRLNKMILASRFIRTLSMMMSAGVGVVEAIELSKKVVDNHVMNRIAGEIKESIMTGSSLSEPMSKYDLFPPVIQQLAGAGEESGILPEMLQKGVSFLDSKIERMMSALLVRIEPILSVVLGLVVGSIMLGVYLPMFDYMGHIK